MARVSVPIVRPPGEEDAVSARLTAAREIVVKRSGIWQWGPPLDAMDAGPLLIRGDETRASQPRAPSASRGAVEEAGRPCRAGDSPQRKLELKRELRCRRISAPARGPEQS
eukprot:6591406-Pyramimonas_sp.AAC.1